MKFLNLLNVLLVLLCVGYGKGAATTNSDIPVHALVNDAVTSTASEDKYAIFNNIPTCSQKDVNLNDCLKSMFEAMQVRFKDGNKELNIPSMNPFALNRTTFQYENGAIKGRFTIKNAFVYGFPETKLDDLDFKINGDKVTYTAKSSLPVINIVGDYKANVNFNNVQIKPRGTFNLTLTEVKIDAIAEGELYKMDGHRFIHLNKIDVDPVVGDLKINATGVFPDPNLSELVLNIANQYWRQLYGTIMPETKKDWGPMMLRIINESLAVIPFDLIVKDN